MNMIFALILLCCGTLSTSPVLAQAQPVAEDRAEAERLAVEAKAQFKAGKFEAAAKLFMQAYAKSHEPALVYNAARAYEEVGQKRDAIALFKLYLTLTEDPAGIQEAQRRIAKLEAPEPLPLPQMATPTTVVTVTRPDPPARTTEWVLSGSALAAVGVGLTLLIDGSDGTHKYTRVDRDRYEAARNEWFVGAGLVGIGAALGGAAYYFWAQPVVVDPQGVALRLTF